MNQHDFEAITINEDDSAAEGYKVLSSGVQLANWFENKQLIAPSYKNPVMLGFLNNVYVDEAERNQGTGTYLVERFIEECFDCDFIFLECDNEEGNEFDLKAWYEGFGFEVFIEADNPIMVLSKICD